MKYVYSLLLSAAAASASNVGQSYSPNQYYHVLCEPSTPSKCSLHSGKSSSDASNVSHAYGMFNDDIEKEGWGKLWVNGDESTQGYYEAGFLVSTGGPWFRRSRRTRAEAVGGGS